MNTKKQSKLKMYLTVRIFLLSNPAITAKLPNFPEFIAALDAAILQIQTNSEQHHYSSKGVTDNKKLLRESVITITVDASGKMQAFAKYTHNTVLLAEIKFTSSGLKDVSSLELVEIANGQYNRIDAHLADVATYGHTAASQTIYRTAIDAYAESIPQPRQSQLKGKENSLLENQGFETGDEAITDIDMVVEIVRLTETTFYAGYKNARKIVEQGTGTLQVQGLITDAVTKQPIVYATLIFKLSGQTEVVLEKETAAKGGFMIKSLSEGIYEVTISKIGYQTKTISINVSSDQLCDVVVGLDKI